MNKQCVNNVLCWVKWEGGEDKQILHPTQTPHMPTFEIPTGSSISKNKLTYCIHKQKAPCAKAPKHRSFTYNHEKGGMTHEWADADMFLTWLTAKELEKAMELIVSQVEQLDSLIWQEWHMYQCTREYIGRKYHDCHRTTKWERIIPSKTGCWCHLTIKLYPDTDKILKKYEEEHDHAIGNENLHFTRLLDMTKELVTNLVHTKAIVCGDYIVYFLADSYLAKTCLWILCSS